MIRNNLIKILDKLSYHKKESTYKRLISSKVLSVGNYTYGKPNIIYDKHTNAKVKIGKFCSIAEGVTIFTGSNHNVNWITTYPLRIMLNLEGKYADGHPSTKGDVIIGNDVWIASNVTILSGVKIGDGAVIAANTIVSKNILPYSVVGGNPQRLLKMRFEQNDIDKLLEIKWWNWDIENIKKATPLLCSENIKKFLDFYG